MKHVVLCVSTLNGKGKKNDHIYYERVGKICFDGVGTEWVYNGRTGNTHTYRPYRHSTRNNDSDAAKRSSSWLGPLLCGFFWNINGCDVCLCVCVCKNDRHHKTVKMYRLTRRKERSVCAEKELTESNSTCWKYLWSQKTARLLLFLCLLNFCFLFFLLLPIPSCMVRLFWYICNGAMMVRI